MNTNRLISDLDTLLRDPETLPPKFQSGAMFHKQTGCYCMAGWIGKVLIGKDAAESDETYMEMYQAMRDRYELNDNESLLEIVIGRFDRAICEHLGDPKETIQSLITLHTALNG